MADERKIVIELKAMNEVEGDEDEPGKITPEEKINKKRKAAVKSAVRQSLSWAAREITAQTNYEVGRYLNLTEDYKNRILLDNITTSISKVSSLGSMIISGATTGSMIGGGYGAAIGAVIGVAAGVASETFNLVRQYNQQDLGLILNDKSTQYSRSRLGLIDNGRGTLN